MEMNSAAIIVCTFYYLVRADSVVALHLLVCVDKMVRTTYILCRYVVVLLTCNR